MIVDVYITVHPQFPGRAFVAAWPPSKEALASLRKEGSVVTHARVSVPEPAPLPVVDAAAFELKYLHRTVQGRYGPGQVTRETQDEVVVTWVCQSNTTCAPATCTQKHHVGTFGRRAFEDRLADGTLKLEDEDHG